MGSTKLRNRREKLFRQQRGLCYWCKQPMRLVPRTKPHHNDPSVCTLDHLHDRWSPLRGTGGYEHVAACQKCNRERSSKNEAAQHRDTLRARSGRFPRNEATR